MYDITNDFVYLIKISDDGITKSLIGSVIKIETERLNDITVVDVTYQFDIEQGQYIEQSRVEREEPLPEPEPTEQDRIEQLESQNLMLMEAIADLYEMMLGAG